MQYLLSAWFGSASIAAGLAEDWGVYMCYILVMFIVSTIANRYLNATANGTSLARVDVRLRGIDLFIKLVTVAA